MPKPTRRNVLQSAATASVAAIGFPYFVPATVLGKDGGTAPSNRLNLGAIGTGGKGSDDARRLMKAGAHCVAVCDVDARNRGAMRNEVNKAYGNEDCREYNDFRELIARDDIDIVSVGTPDHWHGLISIAAANAGKDIYCQKPLVNSIAEGRGVVDAVRKNKVVLQTGSQERSGSNARYAAELVRNGRIGRLHTIRINLPCDDGHHKKVLEVNKQGMPPEMPVPDGFDYDFWLGHTPKVPYTELRCHFWWRFILAYGGGEMTDRGAHVIDIAQLCNNTDETGPVEVWAEGQRSETGLYNAFMEYRFENRFANGVTMIGASEGQRGLKLEGDNGWIFIHIHGGKLEASDPEILQEKIDDQEIQVGRSPGHYENFIHCVKTRHQPVATAEIGHRTATICHLNNIAMLLGGKRFRWDPGIEKSDSDQVNALLSPRMRSPWHL